LSFEKNNLEASATFVVSVCPQVRDETLGLISTKLGMVDTLNFV